MVFIDTVHGLEQMGWIERIEYPHQAQESRVLTTPKCEQDVRRAIAITSSEAVGPLLDEAL
jgi:hypothetical protein